MFLGADMSNGQENLMNKMLFGAAALTVLCVLVYLTSPSSKKEMAMYDGGTAATKKDAYVAYFERHTRPDTFLPLDDEGVQAHGQRMLTLLRQFKDANAQTREIAEQTVGRLGFALVKGGENMGVIRERGGKEFVVAMLDRASYEGSRLRNEQIFFGYMRGTGMILGPIVACPDAVLVSTLYHELGHLLFDAKGLANRQPREAVGSTQYYEEEVAMNELSGQVMDATVDGVFMRLIDHIIDRAGAPPGGKYSLVHQAVSDDDLVLLEKMFGIENAGKMVAGMVMVQFRLSLDFRYIERTYQGQSGPMVQKVARYKFWMERRW
jgi:hypothetical protein